MTIIQYDFTTSPINGKQITSFAIFLIKTPKPLRSVAVITIKTYYRPLKPGFKLSSEITR